MSEPVDPDAAIATDQSEAARIAALHRYEVLDTPNEPAFDEVARLASRICGTPIALISFIDRGRVWFKSRVGLDVPEIPLDIAFCAHTIRGHGLFEVPDAGADPRFATCPLVTGEPNIRFYAGTPLLTEDGFAIGTLCVIDSIPRTLTEDQRLTLETLSGCVRRQLELHLISRNLARQNAELATLKRELEDRIANAFEAVSDGFWEWNILTGEAYYSPQWLRMLGYSPQEAPPRFEFFLSRVHPDDLPLMERAVEDHLAKRTKLTEIEICLRTRKGDFIAVLARGRVNIWDANGKPAIMVGSITDITESKRAARERQEITDRLRLATTVANIGIWEFAIEEGTLTWDDCMFRIYGASPSGFGGKVDNWLNCLHRDDLPRVIREVEAVLAGRMDFNTRFRAVTPNGETRHIEARGVIRPNLAGTGRRMIGVNWDVSERARAEAEVTERERQLQTKQRMLEEAQSLAHVGSWELDQSLGQMTWSAEMYRIMEVDPSISSSLLSLARERVHPADIDRLRVFRDGDGPVEIEHRLIMPDGRIKYVFSQGRISHSDGQRRMRGTLQDVTALRSTNQALRTSEERFRLLVEQASDGFFLHDEEGRILDVNQRACDALGYSRDELLSMNMLEIEQTPDCEAVRSAWAWMAVNKVTATNRTLRRRDGAPFAVEGRCRPFERDGQRLFLELVTDVTERRQLEEQLHQSQKIEAIGRLAGGVSHDFNNLLMVMNGYSDLILRRLSPEDPIYAHMAEIRKAGQTAADLTHQLLVFGRKQVSVPQPLSLNSLILEVRNMLQHLIREDIELSLALSRDPGLIMADPGQVTQLLMNLVTNSRDAMPGGGCLRIETANVVIGEEFAFHSPEAHPGSWVRLSVSDSGTGMDAETRAHLFEPFFTTKAIGKGTGLGLATVYGVVRQAGGFILVHTEPRRGSIFSVYLPQISAMPERGAEPEAGTQQGGAETILVVEDQPQLRKLTQKVLEGSGYHVLPAANAADALASAESYRGAIDLVLTDVVMPGLRGPDMAAELRRRRPGMRVIYMSGHTMDGFNANEAGQDSAEYLQKPVSARDLITAIRRSLGQDPGRE